MKSDKRSAKVRFSSKGQIVIPSSIRKELEIVEGTEATIQRVGDEIRLKPITRATIRKLRGKVKDMDLLEALGNHGGDNK
jgi:AbrB family looped-hinge helix DNA binding protein